MADRQGNWRRENLCYATELRKYVLILNSIPSSIQQDLIKRNALLYGFVIIIISSSSSSSSSSSTGSSGSSSTGSSGSSSISRRASALDCYVGDTNL